MGKYAVHTETAPPSPSPSPPPLRLPPALLASRSLSCTSEEREGGSCPFSEREGARLGGKGGG
eukprot:scaffold35328_cov30-Tisochrysis_lutea.AAC.1